jgi:Tfp pilus assembly protein PilX
LFTARLSQLLTESSAQQMAFRRAKLALQEAEEKLARVRKWSRELENRTAPLLREINQAHTFLTSDLSRAVAHLTRVLNALEAYSESGVSVSPTGPPLPADHSDAVEVREEAPAKKVHSETGARNRETGAGDSR